MIMEIKGGYTFYGEDIGILMLDTVFPRQKGDIGNARTFDFPVRYHIVKDVFKGATLPRDANEVLLKAFTKAAVELENEGCKAITTSCGFLAGFQKELSEAVHIPVFTSTLSLVPMIAPMIGSSRKIGIFTERAEFMTEDLFNRVGWSSENYNVAVYDLPEDSPFNELVIHNKSEGDIDGIKKCIKEMSLDFLEKEKDAGAIVLECQNFAPFGSLIQEYTGLPVFGINQLIEFIEASVNYRTY